MKTEVEKSIFFFFEARRWTLAISVLQTTCSAVVLTICLSAFSLPQRDGIRPEFQEMTYSYYYRGKINAVEEAMAFAATLVQIMSCFISMIAGIILFVGVMRKSARILLLWIVTHVFLLVLAYIGFVYIAKKGDFTIGITDFFVNLIGIVAIWIVNTHHTELINKKVLVSNDAFVVPANYERI